MISSVFFTDTILAQPNAKSSRCSTFYRFFVSDKGFVAVYPMKSQTEFQTAIHWLCIHVDAQVDLIIDGYKS